MRGSIPTSVYVTGGQVHDVNLLDELLLEPGAFYLLDRGYVDFARLHLFTQACAFFVTRAKKNLQFYLRTSRPIDLKGKKVKSNDADHTLAWAATKVNKDLGVCQP